jgi:tetratricopeptide (TPR) repeat protein
MLVFRPQSKAGFEMEVVLSDILSWIKTGWSEASAKDVATIAVSTLAFGISVLTLSQKTNESKVGLRKQLTDILEKLHETNVENTKANDPNFRSSYPQNYGRLISDRRRFLVRQAKYISEQIPILVSPYEMMFIAVGLEDIDDASEADKWFQRAIRKASTEFDKVIVRRQYGRSLFRNGQFVDAREQYKAALNIFRHTSDKHLIYQGDTYERWAGMEADCGDPREASRLYDRAILEYERIRADGLRERQLQRAREASAKLVFQ